MALSPGLGLGVFELDTRSVPLPELAFAFTVLLIMLSSQFCVSSSACCPICTALWSLSNRAFVLCNIVTTGPQKQPEQPTLLHMEEETEELYAHASASSQKKK